MQTTYGRGRGTAKYTGKERKKETSRRQLVQMLACLAVFLTMFIGKGVWPSQVAQTGEQLLRVIRTNTDFRAAFARLGQALSEQDSVIGELGRFCVAVFAPEVAQPDGAAVQVMRGDEIATVENPAVAEEEAEEQQQTALQVGDVVCDVDREQNLPDGYNAQWLWLGDMQTAVPAYGAVTSNFGYRDHPTIGRYAPHGGVDIAADKGDQVLAFADGVVDSVGEDRDFGKYLYLTHPNGVTTFYAHCSAVCVQKGEQVQVGQKVAQVGSTGKSTGSHLHFEVRLDGVRLDPLHYIEPDRQV